MAAVVALRRWLGSTALVLAVALTVSALPAVAQQGPGGAIDTQRDCQTVLACNFRRGGAYRGCISSYSCRACRFVAAKCSVGDRRRTCRRLRCDWGA